MGLSTVLATVLDMVSMEVVMKLLIYSKKKEMDGGGVPVRRFPDVQRRSDPSRMLGAGDPSLIKNILDYYFNSFKNA